MTQSLLQTGLEHYQRGDRAAAEAWFRQALATDPEEPTAHFLLGLLRFEAGDPDGATAFLERVTVLRPGHAVAWQTLGDLRQSSGANAAAASAYRTATGADPALASGWIGLAQSLLALGDDAGATAAGETAVQVAPDNASAWMALAAALARSARRREAADAYRRAAELAPDAAAAHVGLAVELLQLDEPALALASAERGVALDGGVALGWFALGTALRRTGDWGRAIGALERALTLNPNLRAAALSLGVLYADLDRTAPALRWLERAVELAPDDAEAHAALSSVYCAADRYEDGRAHAERALALDASLIAPHQNLARIFARSGEAVAARHHRDIAYRTRSFQLSAAPDAVQRVLLLVTTDHGNTPDRYLLPADRYTRLYWYVEYADERQAAALPDYDVVFNAIGDADETAPTAANVARFLETCAQPVFNPPEAVARTRRDLATALFAGVDGLVVPKVARLSGAAVSELGLREAARRGGVPRPFIARPLGSHGGQGLRLVAGRGGDADETPAGDQYVTAFHDFKSADGLYRKYRIIFVGGRPYPYHLAIGPRWMLHYRSAETARRPDHIAEERRFLEAPEEALGAAAMATIGAIGQRLDLDFAGIDFAQLSDGRVLLFEANATMLVHPEDADGPLAHKNPFVAQIIGAFQRRLAPET